MGNAPSGKGALRPAQEVVRLTARTEATGVDDKYVRELARMVRRLEPEQVQAATVTEDFRVATKVSLYGIIAFVELASFRKQPMTVGPFPKGVCQILAAMRSTVETIQGREVRRKISASPGLRETYVEAFDLSEFYADGKSPEVLMHRLEAIHRVEEALQREWDKVPHTTRDMVNLADDGEPLVLYGTDDGDGYSVYSRAGLTEGLMRIIQVFGLVGPARLAYAHGFDAVKYDGRVEGA